MAEESPKPINYGLGQSHCAKCGHKVSHEDANCPECGDELRPGALEAKPTQEAPEAEAVQPRYRTKTALAVVSLITVGVVLLGAWMLTRGPLGEANRAGRIDVRPTLLRAEDADGTVPTVPSGNDSGQVHRETIGASPAGPPVGQGGPPEASGAGSTSSADVQTRIEPTTDQPLQGEVAPPAPRSIVANGDFSLGNVGFTSDLRYVAPASNCLWEVGYTIAKQWNDPLLHRLFAPAAYMAPKRQTGKEQVLYANAGGTGRLVLWSGPVVCRPNTTYRISFWSLSLNGEREWIPTFQLIANGEAGTGQPAGFGSYAEASMTWTSKNAESALVSIVRLPQPHGGGLVAIANVEMVEVR